MLDYFLISLPIQLLSNIQKLLGFKLLVDERSGEVHPTKIAQEGNLRFTLKGGSRLELSGSIHKHAHGGNYSDFDIGSCVEVLDSLCSKFGIDSRKAIVHNLEFGVNISIVESCPSVFNNILSYRHHPFSRVSETFRNEIGKANNLSQYSLKIYDKGKQYGFPESSNLLRYEIHVRRMQWLLKGGVITLATLRQKSFYQFLKSRLLSTWDQVEIVDDQILDVVSKEEHRKLIQDWYNPRYVENLRRTNRIEHRIQFRKYRRLIKRIADESHLKYRLRKQISDKCNELIAGTNPSSTDVFHPYHLDKL